MTATAIEHRYVCRGAAAALFDCTAPEVLVEGPAGTGKSRGALEKINWACEEWAGIRCCIARQTRASLTESVLVTWEEKVLWPGHPALMGSEASRVNRHAYVYPNGSVVVPSSLETPERLFSTEWDLVLVDEATEISEDAWEKFGRGMRSHKMPYQQRIAVCNPVAPGHWLNQRPNKLGEDGKPKMVRLKSLHRDNPSCTEEYLTTLRSLTGHRRARLYEGRWVAGEGTVYGADFDEDKHTCIPFRVPSDWPIECGYDPGFDHPCAWIWFTIAPNQLLYPIDEIVATGINLPQLARMVKDRNEHNGWAPRRCWGDPQYIFAKRQESQSVFEQMRILGIYLSGWPRTGQNMDAMVSAVRNRLLNRTIKVFNTCTKLIEAFQGWEYKRTVQGELTATDADKYEQEYKDAMDVVRGVVATNPKFWGVGITFE
jgi:hypothetical protein